MINFMKVLYISMHRHDGGNFFPGTGGPQEIGQLFRILRSGFRKGGGVEASTNSSGEVVKLFQIIRSNFRA